MNKTVTANISGVVFHIETDAYEKLHNYLSTIKTYFNDSDGTEEIMADIEARIAELFKEKLANNSDVITMIQVNQVVAIMGEPEQYMDEETAENFSESNYSHSSSSSKSSSTNWNSRKLYRDEEEGNIGGVCTGLGYYFGIDRIWIKAAFLIAVFGFGTGFLLYIILWIIMPAARSTSEKLEMRGEPINVQNIGNTIKDEFNSFKKKVDGSGSPFAKRTENGLQSFFHFIAKVLVYAFKFLSKILGVLFILMAVSGIITFLVFLIGGPFDMMVNNLDLPNFWTTDFAEIFFSSKEMFYTGLVGLILVALIPLLGLLYGGSKLLFNIRGSNRAINISAISLFIIGVIAISVAATTTAAEYSKKQVITESIDLNELTSDTLFLSSLANSYSDSRMGMKEIFIENNEIFVEEIAMDIIKSKSNSVELKLQKTARGRSRKDAGKRADNIMIKYNVDGENLEINPLASVPFNDGYRDQTIKVSLALPIGKTVYLEPSAIDIIYDIENNAEMQDRKMIGHFWTMTKLGLECADCIEEEILIEEESTSEEQTEIKIEDGNVKIKVNATI